jgi:hypothetical protein
MAAVLTLDRTRFGVESCSFSGSAELSEVPADEEDREGRGGLFSSGMKGGCGLMGETALPAPVPCRR